MRRISPVIWCWAWLAAGAVPAVAADVKGGGEQPTISESEFGSNGSAFVVRVRNLPYHLIQMSLFALPKEAVELRVEGPDTAYSYEFSATQGQVETVSRTHWRWTAPERPGGAVSRLAIVCGELNDTMQIAAFTLYPYDNLKNGYLNGYRIGKYPGTLYRGLSIYKPPRGFIEVTTENEQTKLTPAFTLGQFVCKQEGKYPKYVVLREELLLSLEIILEKLNERGYHCRTFNVLSGYRTPYYNKAIGNVKYSRHQWGGAADIFIDENPRDGMMDDLNGDGKTNWDDADVLYDIVDELESKPFLYRLIGGLARYDKTRDHGPFVHVDCRGFRARW